MSISENLLKFIKESPSPYHAVIEGEKMLCANGYIQLSMTEPWDLKKGENYYVKPYGTTLFAVSIGENVTSQQSFHIGAAHTDHPCIHVKPIAELHKSLICVLIVKFMVDQF